MTQNDSETRIGAFEAKTHFSQVLDRVEHGETITITRHGRPVARIVPDADHNRDRAQSAVDRLKALRGAAKDTDLADLMGSIHAEHRF